MVSKHWLLFTAAVAILALLNSSIAEAASLEKVRLPVKLEDLIPEKYDSMQTPMIDGKAANVSLRITILNIRSVDVSEMSFTVDLFLYKLWKDDRLVFPSHVTEDKVVMNPEWRKHIWTPDVFFHNSVEGKVHETIIPYMYLWLRRDLSVFFAARLSIEFSCDMELKRFPHDIQKCDIIIKSLSHTIEEMNLHWTERDNLTVGDLIVLPQFEIDDLSATSCTETYNIETFACLRGIIKLRRRSGYYIINIYIPTILIVFMSMLTFWIPPDAVPARVTLGVTSLLTIVTKQYQASLPSVSYIVGLNIWLSSCIGFVFCSLLEYSMVIALLTRQRKKAKSSHSTTDGSTSEQSTTEQPRRMFFDKWNCNKIDRISRVLFPIAFIGQAILYWSLYTP